MIRAAALYEVFLCGRDATIGAMLRLSALAALAILLSTSDTSPGQRGAGGERELPGGGPKAIVGHVFDPSGKPVPGTFVTALSQEPRAGRAFSLVSARLQSITNERGEFRLEDGLYFGEFYVVALPHNEPYGADRRLNRAGYANTFFPNVVRVADAKRVRVSPSGPARADITLAPARLWAISGTVIGSSGQPIPGGRLAMPRGDGFFGLAARTFAFRTDSTFVAPGLQPGTYHLRFHESPWPPARGTTPVVSGATVVVADADVTDVRVMPIRMVQATGRLIVDGPARSALQPSAIQIGASPVDFDGNPGPSRPGLVKDDLTFAFKTWPSVGQIRVQLPSREWAVKAIRLNSVDVTDKPIDFVAGKEVSGLEIELVKRS